MRYLVMIGLVTLLLTTGCTGMGSLADELNKREAHGCLWMSGAYGLFASGSVMYATGGATLEECRALR